MMKWIALFLAFSIVSSSAEISRAHVLKTGPTERLVEDPPTDIAERTEAIMDAIWTQDYELFVSAAAGPESGRLGFVAKSEEGLEEIIREFRNFYRGDLRTMRHPPKWPTPDAERPWVRVSVQRMNNAKVRGQFILIFSGKDWALERVALNLYNHIDLPAPEPEFENDIIRDRSRADSD